MFLVFRSIGTDTDDGPRQQRSLLVRMLKAAVPLQVALVLLFGIAYILDPTLTGEFHNFGLVFSPQLRYVRGPPPV